MLYSILKDSRNIYINLHAEQVIFRTQILGDIQSDYSLTNETINDLIELDLDNCNYLYLNFKKIKTIQSNQHQNIRKFMLKFKNKIVILYNMNDLLSEECDKILKEFNDNSIEYSFKDEGRIKYLINRSNHPLPSDFSKNEEDLFINEFEKKLIRITEKHDYPNYYPSKSSAVYLNRYIDVKKFIETDKFFKYCLYKLVIKMEEKKIINLNSPNKNTVLFFHTLAGAYIGSMLSDLLELDIFYVDHLGPNEKLLPVNFGNKIDRSKEYIVVSDVVCLGSEIGKAKSYISSNGGIVKGNVSILKIRTMDSIPEDNEVALYTVTKEKNVIDYKIITSIDDNNHAEK